MIFPFDDFSSSCDTIPVEYEEEEVLPFDISAGILEGWKGYQSLTIVDLSYQKITTLAERCFDGLSGLLIELNLQSNSLETISETIFSKLINLERLYLGDNNLTSIPKKIFHGLPLRDLSLNKNRISHLSKKIFSGQHLLESLFLNENRIRAFKAAHFKDLDSLKELYLNDNPVEEIEPASFSSLTNIRTINFCIDTQPPFAKESLLDLHCLKEFKVYNEKCDEVNILDN